MRVRPPDIKRLFHFDTHKDICACVVDRDKKRAKNRKLFRELREECAFCLENGRYNTATEVITQMEKTGVSFDVNLYRLQIYAHTRSTPEVVHFAFCCVRLLGGAAREHDILLDCMQHIDPTPEVNPLPNKEWQGHSVHDMLKMIYRQMGLNKRLACYAAD